MKAFAQYTLTALRDGEDALALRIRSSAATLRRNAPVSTVLTAELSRGGALLTAEEAAALGTVRWYLDGGSAPAGEGRSFALETADSARVEARLETGGAVTALRLRLEPEQPGAAGASAASPRPCRVYTGATLSLGGTETVLSLPAEAGQVCGGTVDLLAGALTVDWAALSAGTLSWTKSTAAENLFLAGGGKLPADWPASPGNTRPLEGYNAFGYENHSYSTVRTADRAISYRPSSQGRGLAIRDAALAAHYADFSATAFAQAVEALQVVYRPSPAPSYSLALEPARLTESWAVATDTGVLEMETTATVLARDALSLSAVYDGTPGPAGADGRPSYLHIKYSDDGERFTANQGETLGAWIGTLVDDRQADSEEFGAYTWRRFADDRELSGQLGAVRENVERLEESLRADYLAISDFGRYQEAVEASLEATAREVVESYEFSAMLEAVNSRFGGVDRSLTRLHGQLRRGLVTDPETGERALGIAIAESLSFTGETVTENGLEYSELSPGQTLGLYTATGWQFWIGGSKRGWFDSTDGMLHVTNLAAGSSLQLGADWLLTAADGLGIRYLGS